MVKTFAELPTGAVFSPVAGEPGRFTKVGFTVADGGFNSVDWQGAKVRYFGPAVPVVELGRVLELEFEVFDTKRRG